MEKYLYSFNSYVNPAVHEFEFFHFLAKTVAKSETGQVNSREWKSESLSRFQFESLNNIPVLYFLLCMRSPLYMFRSKPTAENSGSSLYILR